MTLNISLHEFDEQGNLIDFVSGRILRDNPEERVRQYFLRVLYKEYHYPSTVIDREVPIYSGAQLLLDDKGNPIRADIVVYENEQAKKDRDQGQIRFVVECKAPDVKSGFNQLVSYIFNTSANGGVWFNGTEDSAYYRRYSIPEQKLVPWPGIPRHGEQWDAVGRRKKSELLPLYDIRGTLARCHNKLYRRGIEGDDLTLDMVRILIAKARDEMRPGDLPLFYCTPEEYQDRHLRINVANRIKGLFAEVRDQYPTVFTPYETITVGTDQIVEVVVELQDYRIIGNNVEQWDVIGAAYEQYTADVLKREGGEFFTNRLVVEFMVKMVNPTFDDKVLDPAGGTGGFLTAAYRHVRKQIMEQVDNPVLRENMMGQYRRKIFYIDIKHRLVKIAKTAMILTGDGYEYFIQGDSLLPPMEVLPERFLQQCPYGSVNVILTNPPFAGSTEGRITDPAILRHFQLGHEWHTTEDGKLMPTNTLRNDGVPPEILFIERCAGWLASGGRLGIVLPKGILDTRDALASRQYILQRFQVEAVIVCHKDTFQPHTGTRTCVLILRKWDKDIPEDYPIFMAISKKIGQNSEGEPIFKRDETGRLTGELDHDLDAILEDFENFKRGRLKPSQYRFSINRSQLEEDLSLNPQRYLPHLNTAIEEVLAFGEREGWTIATIGELSSAVWKGTRFKREDLEVEEYSDGADVYYYVTPAAVLQTQTDSIKVLDLSYCNDKRKHIILKHIGKRGQIVISRSGTVGRVSMVDSRLEGCILSDDLIRVEINDELLRLYVYLFLKSEWGKKQMLRNEYGSVQQHLEPSHIRDIVLPVPNDKKKLFQIVQTVKDALNAAEKAYLAEISAQTKLKELYPLPDWAV